MPHILRNKNIELHLDDPLERYQSARFDWTGKITKVAFHDCDFAGFESLDDDSLGQGFYNEFGIDTALGFDQAMPGFWFHKIGVGLLRKDHEPYSFAKAYEIRPAGFQVSASKERLTLVCRSEAVLGYAYVLEKDIALHDDGFSITYQLHNVGDKEIVTDEYVHNFLAINQALLGEEYMLRLPFPTKPEAFGETVNPEGKALVDTNEIRFAGTPSEPFFFSNLSGGEPVATSWELIHSKQGIGIRESVDFSCSKANLWGCGHVISPELFCPVHVLVGATRKWSRRYELFRT